MILKGKILFIVILLFNYHHLKFNRIEADRIIGTYWSPDKDGKINIYKKNGKYYGKSIENKTPYLKDIFNPDPKLRDKFVLGQDVFFDFVFENEEYVDGKVYNPLDGKVYNAYMWLEGNNMKLRGFIGFSIFGQTKTFERCP